MSSGVNHMAHVETQIRMRSSRLILRLLASFLRRLLTPRHTGSIGLIDVYSNGRNVFMLSRMRLGRL